MKLKLPIVLNAFAVCLLIFVVIYFGYYIYISLLWGFGERMLMAVVSDSLFLLLIPAAAGMFMKKSWSWWLTVIIFFQMFVAKLVAIGAQLFLILSEAIAEPLQGSHVLLESAYLIFYLLVVVTFSFKPVKQLFSIEKSFSEWYWRVLVGAIGLYTVHFIVMLIVVSALNPL